MTTFHEMFPDLDDWRTVNVETLDGKQFGALLAWLRTTYGVSPERLTQVIGVSEPSKIADFERGEYCRSCYRTALQSFFSQLACPPAASQQEVPAEIPAETEGSALPSPFGTWVSRKRIELGYTHSSLAAALGISPSYAAGLQRNALKLSAKRQQYWYDRISTLPPYDSAKTVSDNTVRADNDSNDTNNADTSSRDTILAIKQRLKRCHKHNQHRVTRTTPAIPTHNFTDRSFGAFCQLVGQMNSKAWEKLFDYAYDLSGNPEYLNEHAWIY